MPSRRATKEAAAFLNVDLELRSKKDLGPLLAAFGSHVVVLDDRHAGGLHHLALELYDFSRYRDPDACIAGFAQLAKRLPPAARRLWNGAEARFDIGIEARDDGKTFTTRLAPSTLRKVAEVGGALVITIDARTRSARPRSKH